ncbi:hypothetical protein GCM10010094_83220 [Streptomyces flaveus]|uniref:Glyoxalase-like domain-containing protein n=2 Tax=Streptomyces flaveus TaxID=66370 RepID=A0A917RJV3_9ACTN|nr:hypothetical protein GCM10010094_83220 [Streptomyces flaveus]
MDLRGFEPQTPSMRTTGIAVAEVSSPGQPDSEDQLRSVMVGTVAVLPCCTAATKAGAWLHARTAIAPCPGSQPTLFMLTPMALEWEQIIVDSSDPIALGRWWAEALGWVVVDESEEIIEIRPEPDQMPGLLFVPVPEGKTSKNRLHPDFRPDDQEAEVARLLSLGALRADTVQGEQHWVTLLDPEGNEFCVLGERKS